MACPSPRQIRVACPSGRPVARRYVYVELQEHAMLPVRTVFHPTDFSGYSAYAFRLACSLARDYGARLVVPHVATPPMVVYGGGVIPPELVGFKEPLQKRLHQLQAGDPRVQLEHRLVEGDAATDILRVAGEIKCDLIVMGTHGRTGLGRLLMGSVAEQIVRKAAWPVLTVKASQRPVSHSEEPAATAAGEEVEATTL
jgi:nucleotide-binding universal stress UspA family protein